MQGLFDSACLFHGLFHDKQFKGMVGEANKAVMFIKASRWIINGIDNDSYPSDFTT